MVFSFFKRGSEKDVQVVSSTEEPKKEDEKSETKSTDNGTDTKNSLLTAASVYDAAPVSPIGRVETTTSSVSSSPAAVSTPSRSTTATTFDDALYDTCVQDASCVAFVQRVLEQHSEKITRPRVSEVVRAGDVAALARKIKEERQHEQQQTTTTTIAAASSQTPKKSSAYNIASLIITSPRKVYNGVSATLETISNVLVGHHEEDFVDDDDVWVQEGDDAADDDDKPNKKEEADPLVEGKERVVCVELVKQCIECILDQVEQESEQVLVVSQHSRGAHTKPVSCWTGWCRHIQSSDDYTAAALTIPALLKRLPSTDLDFLSRVLVELGHAEQVSDKNLHLLLLRKRNSPPLSDTQRQTCIASFQLEQAIEETEYKIAKWTAAVDDCTNRARQYKSTGDKKAALMQLQKRKLYKEKIDLAEGALLNLHQAQLQLESSQTNVLTALKTTASALKQMRVETPDVDSIVDELQDELEQQQQVETSFSLVVPEILRTDDEELLEELQQLCLEDELEESKVAAEEGEQQAPPLELPEVPTHTPSDKVSAATPSKVESS